MHRELELTEHDKATASIWMPFSDYVKNYFETFEVHEPTRSYHYTSATAARSICCTGEFWLFDIFDTANSDTTAGEPDKNEVSSGVEVICNEIRRIFKRYDGYHFREFSEHLIADMNAWYKIVAGVYTFCMSLSPNPKLWRSAERSGQPGCVEVSGELLVELCNRDNVFDGKLCSGKFIPGIVCYDRSELLSRMRPFIDRSIEALRMGMEKFGESRGDYMNSVKQNLISVIGIPLLAFSQTYKDSRFKDENEIRLLKLIRHPYKPVGEVKHNGRSRITEQVDRNMLRLALDPPPHDA